MNVIIYVMKTVTLTYKVTINANQNLIFAYLTDWEKQSDWILFTDVHKISSTTNQKGTQLVATTKSGPLKFVDTMVVTEWLRPEKIIVEHTGRVILGKGVFRILKITEDTSEFIWEEITPVPFGFVGQMGLLLVKPFMKVMFGLSLRKLKRNIETAQEEYN